MALCVDTVRYPIDGRTRLGVASTFLGDRVEPGDSSRSMSRRRTHFGLPADPSLPIIMIGPGTGIAPFRAFLHERMATKAPGRNWLFFGHQRRDYDFFYEDELTGMKAAGALTRLSLAWSRDGAEKFYVQDRMREVGRDLWAWIADGAHVYVCGDAKRMAQDVERALVEIVAAARRAHDRRGDRIRRQPEEVRPLSAGRVLMSGSDDDERRPAQAGPPRMAALARLPVFLALDGKRAVVAGNGRRRPGRPSCSRQPARQVEVFAEPLRASLLSAVVRASRRAARSCCMSAAWTAADFAGAAIAVGDFDDDMRGATLRSRRARGRRAGQCDRQAGVLRFCLRRHRQPLAAGDRHFDRRRRAGIRPGDPRQARGADPARLCALGRRGAALAHGACRRPACRSPARRRFWQRVHRASRVTHPEREPAPPISTGCWRATRDESAAAEAGSVTLVGAGPGDPELLTLRAVRALQSADVILIDDLVAPEILDFARREAKKMLVGKTGYGPPASRTRSTR